MAEVKQQMRYTDDELLLIKNTFKGNERLLKLLRKTFLPEYDPYAPIGQVVDLWMTLDVRSLTPEGAYIRLIARNELISHVEQQLQQLTVLADLAPATKEDEQAKKNKDSSK